MFRARALPFTRVPPGSPFHNPYGIWRLEPMQEDVAGGDAHEN